MTLCSDVPVDQLLTEQTRSARMVVVASERRVGNRGAVDRLDNAGGDSTPTEQPVMLGVEDGLRSHGLIHGRVGVLGEADSVVSPIPRS